MSIASTLRRTQNSLRRVVTALRYVREGLETGTVETRDNFIIDQIDNALTGEKIDPEHTAYLVAWITVTSQPAVVDAVGIYSEPTPTSDAHWFPIVLAETTAPSFQEAHDRLAEQVKNYPEWHPFARMIAKSKWQNGEAPVFSMKPEEYALWLREEGMRIEPFLELTAGRKFHI